MLQEHVPNKVKREMNCTVLEKINRVTREPLGGVCRRAQSEEVNFG